MGVATIPWEAAAPQRRISLDDCRFAWRHRPAVKGPEMDSVSDARAQKAQPWNTSVRGFGNRAGHAEMKYRFRARAHFCDSPPARITAAGRTVSTLAFTNEIDVGVVLIGRPVPLEVVQKSRPVTGEIVLLEIFRRERKAVVDADQYES